MTAAQTRKGSSSALIGCFPPVCEILQMPLGATEDKEAHDFFFSDYLSHALLSGYSDSFIKSKFFLIIFAQFLPTAALINTIYVFYNATKT